MNRYSRHFLKTTEPHAAPTYSEHTAQAVDVEVRRLIEEQGQRVKALLVTLQPVLLSAAQQLLTREVMTGEELQDLLSHSAHEPILQ